MQVVRRIGPVLVGLTFTLLGGWASAAELVPPADADVVLEEFDVANDGDALLLPVTIKGKTYRFVLDTGANVSVLDKSLPLGDPKEKRPYATAHGKISVTLFAAPEARLGKLQLHLAPLVVGLELSHIRHAFGTDIYGIVGMDALARHVIRLDVAKGKVTILKRLGRAPGRAVPLSFQDGFPYVKAYLPGQQESASFLVDTGAIDFGSGSLRKDLLAQLAKHDLAHKVGEGLFESASGTARCDTWQLSGLTLADFNLRGLLFDEADYNLLSLNYLSRYVVCFDFPNGVMYLRKGSRFDHPDMLGRSGLHIVRVSGRTLVGAVDQGSPAALAGVKKDDEVVQVGGKKASRCRLYELQALLCAKGETIAVRLKRGSKEMQVKLVLKGER